MTEETISVIVQTFILGGKAGNTTLKVWWDDTNSKIIKIEYQEEK
jgi:hypothetical protein